MIESERVGALRLIDACANRAAEGLRVVEDVLRFGRDDRYLSGEFKRLRHELHVVLQAAPIELRLAARESQQDVGAETVVEGQNQRENLSEIAQANIGRAEQGMRSLEENLKLFDASAALAMQRLRFRLYTLQKALGAREAAKERLAGVRLYVILSGGESPAAFEKLVRSLVAEGVGAIQLRDKELDDRHLLERACRLRGATRGSSTLCIINDRPDIAALCQADGVHVGQDELSAKDARAIVGPKALIGVSTHSIEQARQAVLDGANYIGVGPTFPSGTKAFAAFPGLDYVRAVASEIALPAFAIGGIDESNLAHVLAGGASRVAVSGAIERASDPAEMARRLIARLS